MLTRATRTSCWDLPFYSMGWQSRWAAFYPRWLGWIAVGSGVWIIHGLMVPFRLIRLDPQAGGSGSLGRVGVHHRVSDATAVCVVVYVALSRQHHRPRR